MRSRFLGPEYRGHDCADGPGSPCGFYLRYGFSDRAASCGASTSSRSTSRPWDGFDLRLTERIEVLHHEETIAAYATQVVAEPDVLALVVVGSVARATERSTSDVDVYLVVTDEAYAAAQAAGRVAYIDTDAATYDSYVDIKLASPRYLERAVAYADDPTRASFLGARTVFDRTGSVAATIARIVTLPEQVWQRRVHAYRCQARLYGGYFLKQAHERNDEIPAPALGRPSLPGGRPGGVGGEPDPVPGSEVPGRDTARARRATRRLPRGLAQRPGASDTGERPPP